MKTYKVKKGRSNFRPHENPLPVCGAKGWEVIFEFVPGGWSSLSEWEGDRDRYDWQKLKGLTSFFSANNSNSTLAVFRPGDAPGTWEVNAYTNYPGSDWSVDDKPLIIKDGEESKITCKYKDGKANYTLNTGDVAKAVSHQYKAPKVSRRIGTYPGGANNSPGPYGGKAIKDQAILISFKILR
jgi:hypothetical protein